jgi:hypothetical protein
MQTLKQLANVIRKQPSKRYLDYMRSPQWATTREAHLDRVDRWCEHCKLRRACQVHHWTYVRLGFEHPKDLFAVCVDCHHKLHAELIPANDNRQFDLFERKAVG